MGRRILALTPLGTLSTVFPLDPEADHGRGAATGHERRPPGLGGLPVGLMEYVADCEGEGNPTVLAVKIATSFRNAAAGSNVSLALRWAPPYPPSRRIEVATRLARDPVPYSAANLPRFSLLGYLDKIEGAAGGDGGAAAAQARLAACFTAAHPDARYWLPGNPIHTSEFARLVVTQVYWIGGFGDRAYIGWIPVEEWRNVSQREWESIRLPGEKKGWKEWGRSKAGGEDLR
jgi:hypothetical protein